MLKADVVALAQKDGAAFNTFNDNLGTSTAWLSDQEESKVRGMPV